MRSGRALVLLIAFHAAAPHAFADSIEDTKAAKQLYENGLTDYNLGQFESALGSFEHAYRVRHDAVFLFNIAQCQRQLARYQDAERSYRAYLRESSDVTDAIRAQVQKLIADMQEATAEARAKKPPTGTQPPADVAAAVPAHTTASGATASVVSSPADHQAWFTSRTGWLLSGLGLGAVAAGVGLLAGSVGEHNAAVNAPTQSAFDDHHNNTLHFQEAGWPLLGVGGALVVAGVTVFALHAKGRRR